MSGDDTPDGDHAAPRVDRGVRGPGAGDRAPEAPRPTTHGAVEFAAGGRFAQDPGDDVFWADLFARRTRGAPGAGGDTGGGTEGEGEFVQVFVRFPGSHFFALQEILGWDDDRDRNIELSQLALSAAVEAGFWGHELDARDWWDDIERAIEARAAGDEVAAGDRDGDAVLPAAGAGRGET